MAEYRSELQLLGAGAVALAVVSVAMWMVGGPVGLLIAAVAAIVWAGTSAVYAVAVASLLFAVLVAEGNTPTDAAAIASLGTLLAAELGIQLPARAAVRAIATLVVTGGVLASVWFISSAVAGAVVLLVGGVVLAYGVHRYELVRLGIVTEADT